MAVRLLKCRSINSFGLLINKFNKSHAICSSNQLHNQIEESIVIPKRIERGPTDILKALANTIGKDLSAPHYRYHDDPYMSPVSNLSKRSFALAKDSGRRAAQYFFDKYPELFFRDTSEPKIEAFSYREVIDENTSVDVYDLEKCIIRSEVNNAINCYNNIKNSGNAINEQTIHDLLELVCFYNCEEPPDNDYLNEKWYKQRVEYGNTWKDNGFAEQVFNTIENKTSRSYSALIQGMAKYGQTERAYFLYKQMQEKDLDINIETFNSIIRIGANLRNSAEDRWDLIVEQLNLMKSQNVRPNLSTLNAILEQITRFGSWKYAYNLAQKVMVEMCKKLKIEPSLATYYHLLNIFYKEKSSTVSPLLYEIMDEIQNQVFTAQDPKDVLFFVKAMGVCEGFLTDVQLAYRIHEFLNKANHYKLIGDSLSESIYFQKFFRIMCTAESMETFMIIYNKYVPHVYIPEPSVMTDIIEMINLYDAFIYVPQIWTDIVLFDMITKSTIVEQLLKLMAKTKVEETLQKQFVEIAWDAITRIDLKNQVYAQQKNSSLNIEWTGRALGYCITVFLNGNDILKAYEVIKKLENQQNTIVDYPQSQSLIDFCINAINEKQYSLAIHCIRYSKMVGITEVPKSVMKQIESLELDENLRSLFQKNCSIDESTEL